MKRVFALAIFCTAVAPLTSAASCVSGSLTSYIALGAGGCTIGGNTLFNFRDLSGSAGAAQINSASVSITPLTGTYTPGISASVNLAASAGTIYETMFTYSITGATYVSEVITLSGASESGGGAVSDIQNFCEGGVFGSDGVDGCAGHTGTLLTDDGVQNQDSTKFDPPFFLNLTDDLVLDGTFGPASGGKITDQLTSVPEPAPLLITILGFAFVAVSKSRFRIAARSRD